MNKNLTLAVDIGHNVDFDGGAVGIRDENSLNYKVGTKLIEECRVAGINVINCTPKSATSLYDSLSQRTSTANMSAILIECAFCDSEKDMTGYDTSKVAHAIFIGICKVFDIEMQEEHKQEPVQYITL